MTIAEPEGVGKGSSLGQVLDEVPRHYLYAAILILSCSAAFGLGFMEGREEEGGSGVSITQIATTTPSVLKAQPAAVQAAVTVSKAAPAPAAIPAGGEVVASKTGTKYYFPWCGTVKRIKEENKVWFASKEEAEAAGYQPAANCKGL